MFVAKNITIRSTPTLSANEKFLLPSVKHKIFPSHPRRVNLMFGDYKMNILVLIILIAILNSCSSNTIIKSNPPEAELYIDGKNVGKTPYRYSDKKIIGMKTYIKIEKEGYKVLDTTFRKNETFDANNFFIGFLYGMPYLYAMKYKPERTYDLTSGTLKSPITKEQGSHSIMVKGNKCEDKLSGRSSTSYFSIGTSAFFLGFGLSLSSGGMNPDENKTKIIGISGSILGIYGLIEIINGFVKRNKENNHYYKSCI